MSWFHKFPIPDSEFSQFSNQPVFLDRKKRKSKQRQNMFSLNFWNSGLESCEQYHCWYIEPRNREKSLTLI